MTKKNSKNSRSTSRRQNRNVSIGRTEPPRSRKQKVTTWIASIVAATLAASLASWLTPLPALIRDLLTESSPVKITIVHDVNNCAAVATSKPVETISPPPGADTAQSGSNYAKWRSDNELAEIDASDVIVTVKGIDNSPVTVTGLRFDVSRRLEPLRGVRMNGECGDETIARYALVDLDKRPPKIVESSAKKISVGDSEWRVNQITFPYEVTNTDSETLLIRAQTKSCDCDWKAFLSWSNGEEVGTEEISYHGKPFRTTADNAGIAGVYFYDSIRPGWYDITQPS